VARRGLSLEAGAPGPLALDLTLEKAGVSRITAVVTAPADSVPANDRRSLLVTAEGLPGVLMISPRPAPSPVSASLVAGGWPLTLLGPGELDAALLAAHQVLILEQTGIAELTSAHWQAIDRAVRRDGLGLILLGGPGTFASGGYRHSVLEDLLPLLSEAPRPLAPAAVLFAVDKSGSMDLPTPTGASRLELARQALTGSAETLAPGDLAGLALFDKGVTPLLPLAPRVDPAAAVARVWRPAPGGGTLLRPLVEHAVSALTATGLEQRLLVLVSDGRFADGADADELAERLAAADIEVVALAIGDDARVAGLEPLTAHGDGRLLRVADLAELPALMQAQVGARRGAVQTGTILPVAIDPSPFPATRPEAWPAVRSYPVTRLRPGARLHLAAPNGDPLLASQFSGAGRAVALPAGLGSWAPDWSAWADWGRFLGGLVQWAAAVHPVRGLTLSAESGAESVRLRIDASSQGDWSRGPVPVVEVTDPAGRDRRLAAEPIAPGRYEAEIPAPQVGGYDIRAIAGSRTASLSVWHQPLDEFLHGGADEMEALLAGGLLRRWSPAEGALPEAAGRRPARPLLTLLALGLYLLSILAERVPRRGRLARRARIFLRTHGAATDAP
jgi:hypothetical protein